MCTQTNRFFRKGLFCIHLEITHRYGHEHVTQTKHAPKGEVQKAQEVKPEPQQCHQTMNGKVHLMFIAWAPKKLGARLSWNNIKNSALARPISGLTFIVSTIARDLPVSLSVPLSSVPPPKASSSLLRGGLSSLFHFCQESQIVSLSPQNVSVG